MKNLLVIWLILNCSIVVAVGQNDDTPIVLHKPTQADMAAARAEYESTQNALPLEQKDVAYLIVDKSSFTTAPAFIDPSSLTAYEWQGVVLQPSQVPNLIGTRSGSGLIVPIDPQQSGYQIKEIDPPIRYVALDNSGKYGVGYYDPRHKIFYRWDNVEFDRNELPANAEGKSLILVSTAIANTSIIAPPSRYAPPSPKATPASQSSTPPPPSSSEQPQPEGSVPVTQVPSESEANGLPWWFYAIVVLSLGAIGGLWYFLRPKK